MGIPLSSMSRQVESSTPLVFQLVLLPLRQLPWTSVPSPGLVKASTAKARATGRRAKEKVKENILASLTKADAQEQNDPRSLTAIATTAGSMATARTSAVRSPPTSRREQAVVQQPWSRIPRVRRALAVLP